jgi:ketosteroid isomerase-like protein
MSRLVVPALVLVLSINAAGCVQPPPPVAPAPAAPVADAQADVDAITAAREAFMKAYEAGDAEAIGRLYAEDAISEPNHQPTLEGRAAIVNSLKSMFEQVTVKPELVADETRTLGNVGLDRALHGDGDSEGRCLADDGAGPLSGGVPQG